MLDTRWTKIRRSVGPLKPLDLPPFAIGAPDVSVGFFDVSDLKRRRVPIERPVWEPRRQAAEQDRFRERSATHNQRHARRLAVAATGFDELKVVVLATGIWQLGVFELLGG